MNRNETVTSMHHTLSDLYKGSGDTCTVKKATVIYVETLVNIHLYSRSKTDSRFKS